MPDAHFTIRPCRLDECQAVLDLWKQAGATPSLTDTLLELRRVVQENGDLFLVAEQEGRIVGTVLAGWDGWRGNLYRLAVLPEHRHRSIGRALVLEAERRLFVRGARRLTVLVEHMSPIAMGFWKSLEDFGYHHDPRMVRYTKTLGE
jgi:ribosomal protein S18 acetylase RimI-like enzyme